MEDLRLDNLGVESTGLSHHGGSQRIDSTDIDSNALGQGSLSRFLDTSPTAQNSHIETDPVQPLIFAVIAVIIGILIL
ncbi:MAG: hypothetical protein AAF703_04005 [Cyanobacteria bacterium P01_D01_bin.105]